MNSSQGVTLRATQPHVSRRLAALLGDAEPVLAGPTWVDELYETLAAMTPSERSVVRALEPGGHEDSAETVLQRGRSPWLPALLDDGDLFMAYQPIVDLSSGRTVAYEALVRGSIADDETVAGHQIVAAARAHDRIRQLDESSRRLALEQAAGALEGGERLFVNFDPMSVYDPEVCLRNTWAHGAQGGHRHRAGVLRDRGRRPLPRRGLPEPGDRDASAPRARRSRSRTWAPSAPA